MTGQQICNRCVMDKTAHSIVFDAAGICNFCTEFLTQQHDGRRRATNSKEQRFVQLVNAIKQAGRGKKYDCIVGISGGVDSSYALHLAVSHGLRPLAVHMDNGWDSELAQHNIANLVKKLNVGLYTHVIDWQEYKGLMQAFFAADVIDVELLYDNAMIALNYQMAAKYDLRYILSGCNRATEGIRIPANWNTFKLDKKNIQALAKRGHVQIKTFPSIGLMGYLYARLIKKIQWIFTLDYIDYNKQACVDFLHQHYDFKPYPYKHYESVFTRFYQAYILPQKFGVDKRKVHFSSLIMSGQMDRTEALQSLEESPYPSRQDLAADKTYFLKKMQWNQAALDHYLKRPMIHHAVYGSEYPLAKGLEKIWKLLR